MRKFSTLFLLLTCPGLLLLNGCALILHGSHQSIPVSSVPSGANVMVKGSKSLCPQSVNGWCKMAETPGIIAVRRGDRLTFRFEKDGFKPVEVSLKKSVTGATFGNLIIGGVIGFVIDFSTGAAYKQTPEQVSVTLDALSKTTPSAALKHHSKDTILVVFREKTPGEPTGEALSVE